MIHNKLIEIQGNIRVICRARPVLEVELKQGGGAGVDVTDFPAEDVISIQRDPATKTRFEFDRVFSPSSSQEEVFSAVQPLCISVLDGYNVSRMAKYFYLDDIVFRYVFLPMGKRDQVRNHIFL